MVVHQKPVQTFFLSAYAGLSRTMKLSFSFLTLQSLLLIPRSFSQVDETIKNPNSPAYNSYSCVEQEQTCGLEADHYYELVAGYNMYWVEACPSVEAVETKDFFDRSGGYW
jgi:hypothetical protein